MDKKIASIIKYFAVFDYFPNFMDVYTFFPEKITKKKLKRILEANKYTPPQYSIQVGKGKLLNGYMVKKQKINNLTIEQFNNLNRRKQISQSKLNSIKFNIYIKLLSIFPQIKLVGLSGSISMMNAGEEDDIDLFIITAKNRLFTGRFIALILAQIFGLRRNREARSQNFLAQVGTLPVGNGVSQVAKNFNSSLRFNNETMKQSNNDFRDKVCLNLFFDERELKVPKFKQTVFVGHEVLQMKPIIDKGDIYERFLEANEWVFRLFPNGKSKYQILNIKSQINFKRFKFKILNLFGTWNLGFRISNKIESFLKKLQLHLINKHKTTEIITPTQLWFHPNDYNSFM